eukprot:FR736489.1.p1 GENE.FR736489.1~~FR736489.1.p1  ORF type:complete len:129 (-),score=4.08 FR736489.1:351-737(-)
MFFFLYVTVYVCICNKIRLLMFVVTSFGSVLRVVPRNIPKVRTNVGWYFTAEATTVVCQGDRPPTKYPPRPISDRLPFPLITRPPAGSLQLGLPLAAAVMLWPRPVLLWPCPSLQVQPPTGTPDAAVT